MGSTQKKTATTTPHAAVASTSCPVACHATTSGSATATTAGESTSVTAAATRRPVMSMTP
jgi:hypothetical protein